MIGVFEMQKASLSYNFIWFTLIGINSTRRFKCMVEPYTSNYRRYNESFITYILMMHSYLWPCISCVQTLK